MYNFCFPLGALAFNPSALHETVVEIPQLSWDDISGLRRSSRSFKRLCSTPWNIQTNSLNTGPELLTMWSGKSEASLSVRDVFDKVHVAAPCIMFLNKLDLINRQSPWCLMSGDAGDRMLDQILTEMDSMNTKQKKCFYHRREQPSVTVVHSKCHVL